MSFLDRKQLATCAFCGKEFILGESESFMINDLSQEVVKFIPVITPGIPEKTYHTETAVLRVAGDFCSKKCMAAKMSEAIGELVI